MKTEKEKMLAGELYNATDLQLVAERRRCRLLLKQLNDSTDEQVELRRDLLRQLIGLQGPGLWIEPPFYCDYGSNISVGAGVYFNFDCVILDVASVTIGDDVLCGPKVQIYTATHPMAWEERAAGLEFAKPIAVGSHVWIGGGAILCPGVTVGDRSVIGAGCVVTRDVPPDVFFAGNPGRVIRSLDPAARVQRA
ncbi:MAG TPA: sugar O-acetyltransferase [Anaerolineae bacterium]|nr:sugar O-acetyltransferase [Anaerolineae bacterium]HNU02834.1 sugar O-acetyltransferase [Anaerolineae bacterium]